MRKIITSRIEDSIKVKQRILCDDSLQIAIQNVAEKCIYALKNSKKLIVCGNGGSASDALHFAGEIVGRFQRHREAWSVIVLNSDVATMTAVSNDYGFDEVFARQAKAHTNPGDIFIGISTSGNSENVFRAVKVARECGASTIALLGCDGGRIKDIADHTIVIPSNVTARIQECHILIIHIICELIENAMSEK